MEYKDIFENISYTNSFSKERKWLDDVYHSYEMFFDDANKYCSKLPNPSIITGIAKELGTTVLMSIPVFFRPTIPGLIIKARWTYYTQIEKSLQRHRDTWLYDSRVTALSSIQNSDSYEKLIERCFKDIVKTISRKAESF